MIETLFSLARSAGHDLAEKRGLSDGRMPWHIPTIENPAVPLSAVAVGGSGGAAMPYYPADMGTRFTAVWAAIRVLSGVVARTSCRPVVTNDGGASWKEAREHYLWPLLMGNWNEAMTAYRAKRLMQAWLSRDGNAYAFIDYSPANGRVRELLPMRPDRVEIREGRYYYYSDSLGVVSYSPKQILHLRGLQFDGVYGISPLAHFRRTIGMALAQEEHRARFYANGARPGGVLSHPGVLDASTKERMRRDWQENYGGASNAHRTAILDEGVKYEPIVMSMVDAEFTATFKLSLGDISRIYGVPLHMLAELDPSTNNNIEHQGLELENHVARDLFCNWEAELTDGLLSREERRTVRIAFDAESLHSPDMESRMNIASVGVRGGVLMPDEARGWFGLPSAEGGDRLYMQQQMIDLANRPEGGQPV